MKRRERWLLALFPARFRRRFEADLLASLRASLAEARAADGPWRRLRLRLGVLLDFTVTAMAERLSDQRAGGRLRRLAGGLRRDGAFAVRQLRRSPGFTLAVAATMALAIGANTAVFSVLYGVLLRPLPYESPQQLVYLWGSALTETTVAAWSDSPGPLQDSSLVASGSVVLSGHGPATSLSTLYADARLLDLLGATLTEGRWLTETERRIGEAVVVLRADQAVRLFGSTAGAVGRTVRLDDREHTVIGILSRETAASFRYAPTLAVLPIAPTPDRYGVVARLKKGVGVDEAREILTGLPLVRNARASAFVPALQVESLHERIAGLHRRILSMLYWGVVLVLALACVNVAHLFLVRTGQRARELAVRASLGAGRLRLIRQLLVEGLVAAALGAAGGLLLAPGIVQSLLALAPERINRSGAIGIDLTVLGYSLALTVLAGTSFVLLPALTLRRCDLHPGRASGAIVGGRRRLRSGLTIVQVALTVIVLGAASMLTRTLLRLNPSEPGFDPESKLVFDLRLPQERYPDSRSRRLFFERLLDELEALPGVRAAEAASDLPFSGSTMILPLFVDGQPWEGSPTVHTRISTAGYLGMLGVPVLDGSRPRNGGRDEIWINADAAHVLFPGARAVGRRLEVELDDGRATFRVAGVLASTRLRGTNLRSWPEVFVPFTASPSPRMSVVVATHGPPDAVAADAADVVARLDPLIPVERQTTLASMLRESVELPRFNATVMGAFAALTLVLSCVGIFGAVAHGVTAARREIGIRLALGATARAVVRLVYSRALGQIAIGAAIGLAGAYLGARWLDSLLFGLSPGDPWSLMAAVGLMAAAGTCAAAQPVWRATRIDPTLSMRAE